ncbi:MAG TPA: DUF4124 domain-containing protein [Steroidobacteraceae bacterium]
MSAGFLATAAATTVYKWVDDNGVVHYSDQPHENAQKVELKAPQTYSAPKINDVPSTAPASTRSAPQGPAYKSCQISAPTNDQMFMNTATVTAGVSLQPQPRPGDQLVVTLDGQRVPGVPAEGGQFTISPVDRGTHSLQATVLDSRGLPVCQSQNVTFHVHQPSVLSPNSSAPTAPGVVRPRG